MKTSSKPAQESRESLTILLGLFVAFVAVAVIPALWTGRALEAPFLVAPLGASATLMVLSPEHSFSRPATVVFGNTIAALVGMTVAHLIHTPAVAAAASLAIAVVLLRTVHLTHPPSSGFAVMSALNGAPVLDHVVGFLLLDVVVSSLVLTTVIYFMNRWLEKRRTAHGKGP